MSDLKEKLLKKEIEEENKEEREEKNIINEKDYENLQPSMRYSVFKPDTIEKKQLKFSKFSNEVDFISTKANAPTDLWKISTSWEEISKLNILSILMNGEDVNETLIEILKYALKNPFEIGTGYSFGEKTTFEGEPYIAKGRHDRFSEVYLIYSNDFDAFYNKETLKMIRKVENIYWRYSLSFTRDKGKKLDFIYHNVKNNSFERQGVYDGEIKANYEFPKEDPSLSYSYRWVEAWKEGKRIIISTNGLGKIRTWDFYSGEIIDNEIDYETSEYISWLYFSKSLKRLFIVFYESIIFIDINTFKKIKRVYYEQMYDIIVTKDEKFAIYMTNLKLKMIDLDSGLVIGNSPTFEHPETELLLRK